MERYLARVSGPVLDRIDIQVALPPVEYDVLASRNGKAGERSEDVLRRVEAARAKQRERRTASAGVVASRNARLSIEDIEQWCALDREGETLLRRAMEKLGLSARAYHRILRVSRTIADLEGSEAIRPGHVAEAIQYRSLDRLKGGSVP